MTCAMCGSVGCPYCRGAIPTIHSGHRVPLQDLRCPEQRSPISSDAVRSAPTKLDGSNEISGCLGVNVVTHDAPIIDQEHRECLSSGRLIP